MPEQPHYERPCAAKGLISYRYLGRYGWIVIGATNDLDALTQAGRSTTERPLKREKLEVWNGTGYQPVEVNK